MLRDALGASLPEYVEARSESADLTQIVPAEYHADLVVQLIGQSTESAAASHKRADRKAVFAIGVEVQLARDARKRFTWPLYAIAARARFKCNTTVLVIAPDPGVARWAAQPIVLGPSSVFQPCVLGPDAIPVVRDPAVTSAAPELGVLSTIAHGRGDVSLAVEVAHAATEGLLRGVSDRDRFVLYSDLIDRALSEAARKAFQMLPKNYEFQAQIIRQSIAKGRKEGIEKGREEGLVAAKAACVLAILNARGFTVSARQKRVILGCTNLAILDGWIARAAVARTTQELFV
jgi:hypothetical protein